MARYVDAEKLVFESDEQGGANGVLILDRRNGKTMRLVLAALKQMVDGLPTEDVEPVVHGRWIDCPWGVKCSVCEFVCDDEYYLGERKGCPNRRSPNKYPLLLR